MLKKAEYKIYKNEDYIVEVQKREADETQVDFWLYNIHYGAKLLIFRFQMDFHDENLIQEYIDKNIELYKEIYQEKFKDMLIE